MLDFKAKIRQKLREVGTTEPLGNKQPWTIYYEAIEPLLENNQILNTIPLDVLQAYLEERIGNIRTDPIIRGF